MSLVLLGILNSQSSGAGGAAAYDLLETQVLASPASSVTFTGLDTLASGYQHLQIRGVSRSAYASANTDPVILRMNGVSSSVYAIHNLQGQGGFVSSNASTSQSEIRIEDFHPTSNGQANMFSAFVMDILDFSNASKNTTARMLRGSVANETRVHLTSGLYAQTTQVTSLSFDTTRDNFAVGTRFSIYGVK